MENHDLWQTLDVYSRNVKDYITVFHADYLAARQLKEKIEENLKTIHNQLNNVTNINFGNDDYKGLALDIKNNRGVLVDFYESIYIENENEIKDLNEDFVPGGLCDLNSKKGRLDALKFFYPQKHSIVDIFTPEPLDDEEEDESRRMTEEESNRYDKGSQVVECFEENTKDINAIITKRELPKQLVLYFQDARACIGFELYNASVILCHAIVEEALQVRYGKTSAGYRDIKIQPFVNREHGFKDIDYVPIEHLLPLMEELNDDANSIKHKPFMRGKLFSISKERAKEHIANSIKILETLH